MISIDHPVTNEVIQRANNNVGYVLVEGTCDAGVTSIAVELTPKEEFPNQGEKTGRFILYPSAGKFSNKIPVKGGWYELVATAYTGTVDGSVAKVSPVGVGEVFVLFGHSVVDGDPTGYVGATDKRVVSPSHFDSNDAKVAFEFGPLNDYANRGPFNKNPTAWGFLGDMLVSRLGVPVCFYGAGFGGSNIEQNWKAINDIPFNHGFINYEKRMPYEPLKRSLEDFCQKTGVRAILTQHGINDAGRDEQTFYDQFKSVIEHTRSIYDANLPFVLVLDHNGSDGTNPERAAIRRLWELPGVFPGFDYLEMTSTMASETDKVHPKLESEWRRYASLMNASISTDFLAKSSPVLTKGNAAVASPENASIDVPKPNVNVPGRVKVGNIFAGPLAQIRSLVPEEVRDDVRETSKTTKIIAAIVVGALVIALIIETLD